MVDALTNFTDFILKPAAPFAAGVALFGVVWGFFKGVESVLTEDTKLEIAVWLLGVKVGQKVEPWPETFSEVFDKVFGTRHLSWKCFSRSFLVSFGLGAAGYLIYALSIVDTDFGPLGYREGIWATLLTAAIVVGFNVFPDYISLLETRYILRLMKMTPRPLSLLALLLLDLLATPLVAVVWFGVGAALIDKEHLPFWGAVSSDLTIALVGRERYWIVYPALFTSIWLWLYAGSGFLLKAARRFDIGFDWFNRHFEVEKKPLQCIGLVAGALVAVGYWAAVVIVHLV